MSKAKLEFKIGTFVLLGLVLLGVLLVNFSKGASVFAPTYDLRLRTSNIGGLIPGAKVVLAGVPIGSVAKLELDPSGRTVVAFLRIYKRYQIHGDASFFIEQAGFLGDQYVFVRAEANEKPPLTDGTEVACQEPFNIQEAARSAQGLIQRVDTMVQQVNAAVDRVDKTLLAEDTLNSLTTTITNLRTVSEKTMSAVTRIERLVETNAPTLTRSVNNFEDFSEKLSAVTNLVHFSERLNQVADELQLTIQENRGDIRGAVKNVEEATVSAKTVLADLQSGKGLAGSLLQDEQLQAQFGQIVTNVSILSSNLSRFGLLYKPKVNKSTENRPSDAIKSVYPKANLH
jgi:phospholipid/cholesterol/gamma-HCH transport system substrate-binding protein